MLHGYCIGLFFFFKQKTAYEMRISDWSSDVCSSDLLLLLGDMGIGNTTAAAALAAMLFGGDGRDWVGPGTGVNGAAFDSKIAAEIGRASCRERVCQYV